MMITYLITGSTGYIGRMLVNKLLEVNNEIYLILPVRNVEKAESLFADNLDRITFVENDISDMLCIKNDIDYIIHCAATTTSAYMISNPIEVADGIVLGTRNILELAKCKNIKSMVYLSSMEVYGNVSDIGRAQKEHELGEISLNSSRSCYPLAKRMAEHYCHIYAQEYGVPVKIARLAQTFGRGVRLEDNRVYMQFARAVQSGNDIVLKTHGNSMGNYCATDDAVSAIFKILDLGINGEVYNVVNEANTMTIRDMAHFVADKIAGGRIKVRIEAEDLSVTGYAPDTGLRLSSEKLRGLGWKPTKDLVQMYEDVLKEINM